MGTEWMEEEVKKDKVKEYEEIRRKRGRRKLNGIKMKRFE